MDPNSIKALAGAAGSGSSKKLYVDEVFAVTSWVGTGSAQTITTGINISDGGFFFIKNRTDSGTSFLVYDTERDLNYLKLNDSIPSEQTETQFVTAVSGTGFTTGTSNSTAGSAGDMMSCWTFAKAPGFLDVVKYDGNGTNQQIAHELDAAVGMMWIKRLDGGDEWYIYHKDTPADNYFEFKDDAIKSSSTVFNNTAPTSTHFSVGAHDGTNHGSGQYIAYIFANGATAFGDDVDQSIIKCGSWTGNGSATGPVVNLGWEPQFILFKNKDGGNNWGMHDVMRGIVNGGNDPYLMPDQSAQEDTAFDAFDISATGFQVKTDNSFWNTNGNDYIYMAIRRSDGYVSKPATAGTDVFAITSSNASASIPSFVSGFPVDFGMVKNPTYTATWYQTARLMGLKHLVSADNSAESGMSWAPMDSNKGWGISFNSSHNSWMWKRGRGFDVVTWDGTGANNTLNHSLGKTPEMIWVKARSEAQNWITYHKGLNGGTTPWNYYQLLNTDAAEANWSAWVQAPTSTQFSIISNWSASNQDYVAMLFASVDGISKVGHYTGDGTTNGSKEITLGFNPKFLMLKSTAAGDWLVYDAFRGFYFSSASAYIKLNENAYAQSFASETVRKTSTGFTLWSTDNSVNANGVDVLYYAHV